MIAPTTAMAEIALVSDISGVCSRRDTRLITCRPMKVDSMNTNSIDMKSNFGVSVSADAIGAWPDTAGAVGAGRGASAPCANAGSAGAVAKSTRHRMMPIRTCVLLSGLSLGQQVAGRAVHDLAGVGDHGAFDDVV